MPRTTIAALAKSGRTQASDELLAWYDRHARVLPWRARAPMVADPYRVWLSEIMLQQTTVAAVGPYFQTFITRWPTVEALARARLDDVLSAWAGLGYYARARNLHRCAQAVMDCHGGRFPESEEELRALPGIGAYTAAAILAIAYDRPAVAVDGNVERVVARLFAIGDALPGAKPKLREAAARLAPLRRSGDYAQAVMDLGATICTPRNPRCVICPWASRCAARRRGDPEAFPVKAQKKPRPRRVGIAFMLLRDDGAVWLRRRAERGLLGGMLEVPSTPWEAALPDIADVRRLAPTAAGWRPTPGAVHHVFTHFELELIVWIARAESGHRPDNHGVWIAPAKLATAALPSVMRKVVEHGMKHAILSSDRDDFATLGKTKPC
jgi:A/G-specific adenine glycosylase